MKLLPIVFDASDAAFAESPENLASYPTPVVRRAQFRPAPEVILLFGNMQDAGELEGTESQRDGETWQTAVTEASKMENTDPNGRIRQLCDCGRNFGL